ncbi:MAG: hypothetical protein M1814_003759 [Vezdaea aestivalis]|nr:MAG: hypothetical protein M1814_003759 [Vezdaea aestivalis]
MASSNDTDPVVGLLGQLSLIQPYIPTYIHLLTAAAFPIFIGAHASLSRPSSAAPRKKVSRSRNYRQILDGESEDEDDEGEEDSKMEGLQPTDALLFPVIAGSLLAGLYFLLKWLQDPKILNTVLNAYFSLMAIWSVGILVQDSLDVAISFIFPHMWIERGRVVYADRRSHTIRDLISGPTTESTTPPSSSSRTLANYSERTWAIRKFLTDRWTLAARYRGKTVYRGGLGFIEIAGWLTGLATSLSYNFIARTWFLTNIMGFGFAYGTLQLLSPTTFETGSLVLAALFFYDIYFVFYTPMMVSVATSLEVPIKLLFPRPTPAGMDPSKTSHAMLGLGDVVIPGILIGLTLRFDLFMHYHRKASPNPTSDPSQTSESKPIYRPVTGSWGTRYHLSSSIFSFLSPFSGPVQISTSASPTAAPESLPQCFPKPYFKVAMAGYVAGLVTTLGVMHVFGHAQPALLYLVPGVLGAVWGTAWARGEVKIMRGWKDEVEAGEVKEGDGDTVAEGKGDKAVELKKGQKDESKKVETEEAIKENGRKVVFELKILAPREKKTDFGDLVERQDGSLDTDGQSIEKRLKIGKMNRGNSAGLKRD